MARFSSCLQRAPITNAHKLATVLKSVSCCASSAGRAIPSSMPKTKERGDRNIRYLCSLFGGNFLGDGRQKLKKLRTTNLILVVFAICSTKYLNTYSSPLFSNNPISFLPNQIPEHTLFSSPLQHALHNY